MQIKRFTWYHPPTAWEVTKSWRAARSNMTQRFQQTTAGLASSLTGAQINFSNGMSTLAAQAAINGANAQLKNLQSRASSVTSGLDLKV